MDYKRTLSCVAAAALFSSPAGAANYQVSGAHVILVEGTYSPSSIRFAVDLPAGACSKGTFLFFHPTGSNDAQQAASSSAVMASLLTAKMTNTTISFGGDDAGCNVNYVISQ